MSSSAIHAFHDERSNHGVNLVPVKRVMHMTSYLYCDVWSHLVEDVKEGLPEWPFAGHRIMLFVNKGKKLVVCHGAMVSPAATILPAPRAGLDKFK